MYRTLSVSQLDCNKNIDPAPYTNNKNLKCDVLLSVNVFYP